MTRLSSTPSHDSLRPAFSDNPALPQPLRGILAGALDQGATDIHIDTWGDRATVRHRIDGVPRELKPLDADYACRPRSSSNSFELMRADSKMTGKPLPGCVPPPTRYRRSKSSKRFRGRRCNICPRLWARLKVAPR